ncbi:MAG: hypothetical protein HBSAPP03_08850 [Phycisphaerae bacterium]|nr:MAG: hypothetical protein HBSAPP03_08850 [Phycisphaerae bacterium]
MPDVPTADTACPRVLLFTDTLADVNGVSRFIRDMAAEARRANRELIVFTSTNFPCEPAANLRVFPPIVAMPMPRYSNLELVLPPTRAMLAAARALHPDAVHVSTPGPVGLLGRFIARRLRVPLVGTYHTDFPAYVERLFDESAGAICHASMRAFYAPFERVLTRSRGFVPEVERLGVPRDRIAALTPGIRTETFSPSAHDPLLTGFTPGVLRVLSVGRVSVEKNLPLLAQAWALADMRLREANVDAELVVVGDGPYRAEMERALRGTRHVFTGFRHDAALAATYAGADLFVFPSRTDTLGQAVMEAQASGLPAIVSDAGGPREIVVHGETGMIVPGERAAAWADAIVTLAIDAPRRAAMGRRAAEFMRAHSIRASFEHFWALHSEVIAQCIVP